MPKRLKTVFPNGQQTIHVWAQQSQPTGRTSARNISFDGVSLYSYNAEIARFVSDEVVFHSTRKWTKTTSKYQCWARGATSQYTSFYVPSFDNHDTNLLHLKHRFEAEVARVKRARERPEDWRMAYVNSHYTQLHDYVCVFCHRIDYPDWDDVVAEINAHWDAKETRLADPKLAAKRERQRAKRAEQEAEKERLRLAGLADQIEGWKAGKINHLPWNHGPTLLRVKGQRLETSHGAQVPLDDAVRVFRFVRALGGRGWQGSIPVGNFTVTEVESDGSFRAGCHFITWPEIERVAREIGVFEEEKEVA